MCDSYRFSDIQQKIPPKTLFLLTSDLSLCIHNTCNQTLSTEIPHLSHRTRKVIQGTKLAPFWKRETSSLIIYNGCIRVWGLLLRKAGWIGVGSSGQIPGDKSWTLRDRNALSRWERGSLETMVNVFLSHTKVSVYIGGMRPLYKEPQRPVRAKARARGHERPDSIVRVSELKRPKSRFTHELPGHMSQWIVFFLKLLCISFCHTQMKNLE